MVKALSEKFQAYIVYISFQTPTWDLYGLNSAALVLENNLKSLVKICSI